MKPPSDYTCYHNAKLEENTERRYTYEERLGILGLTAADYPTPEQDLLARAEADDRIREIELGEARETGGQLGR